jgi:hypothetical protein
MAEDCSRMNDVGRLVLCMAATIACSSSGSVEQEMPSLPVSGSAGADATRPTAGMVGSSAGDSSSEVAGVSGGRVGPRAGEGSPVAGSAGMDEAASGGAKTACSGGRWTVPEPTYGAIIETDIEIEMSDGVVLVGDVSYPTDLATCERASGGFPVLLTQNPYGSASFVVREADD